MKLRFSRMQCHSVAGRPRPSATPPSQTLCPQQFPPASPVQVGQDVDVLCLGKDQKGNVRLSRKALLARQAAQAAAKKAVGQGGGLDAEK